MLKICIKLLVAFMALITLADQSDRSVSSEDKFYHIARDTKIFSDKCGSNEFDKDVRGHTYQTMYSMMIPRIEQKRALKQPIKLFEIGLGCHMTYGPGASVGIWQRLLKAYPSTSDTPDEIWEAEVDVACAKAKVADGSLNGIHVVYGDQSDLPTVESWKTQSKGNIDFMIDDGGHDIKSIYNSFSIMWDAVAPGGFYFIEDIQATATWLKGLAVDGNTTRDAKVGMSVCIYIYIYI